MITLSKAVINMMVMRMKASDLTNQAVQWSQLGRPIIFIDSCENKLNQIIFLDNLRIKFTLRRRSFSWTMLLTMLSAG